MAIFPGEPGLAGCPLNSPPFILEHDLNVLNDVISLSSFIQRDDDDG